MTDAADESVAEFNKAKQVSRAKMSCPVEKEVVLECVRRNKAEDDTDSLIDYYIF